jgi:hypothetical protein
VCVAVRTEPFSDIGLTAVSSNCSKEATTRKSIHKWYKSFDEAGCICAKKKNSGRGPSYETVKTVRASSHS